MNEMKKMIQDAVEEYMMNHSCEVIPFDDPDDMDEWDDAFEDDANLWNSARDSLRVELLQQSIECGLVGGGFADEKLLRLIAGLPIEKDVEA